MFNLTADTSITDLRDAPVREVMPLKGRIAEVWPDAAGALRGLDASIRMGRVHAGSSKLDDSLGDLVDEWNAPNVGIYERIENTLGRHGGWAEQACEELRQIGLAVQTYAEAAQVIIALRALNLLPADA